MRIQTLLLILAALAATAAVVSTGRTVFADKYPYGIGSTVSADMKLQDIYGKEHALGDYRGKIVFIHFWSIVCPSEKLAEPKCKEIQKEFGDKGVVEIAINANQRELNAAGDAPYARLRQHVEQAALNFLVTVDPGNKITDMLGGQSTPHCFVIDKNGVLRYSGALDDDPRGAKGNHAKAYVRDAIQALLAGQPVPVATTKPYG
jgi:thiol-disulfide isomerase/thioredoxin